MNRASASALPNTPPVARTNTSPLISVSLWGGFQLVLLALAAGQVPLWAHHPFPRENVALNVLSFGQVLLLVLLFPIVGSSWKVLLLNGIVMVCFDELAGLIAAKNQVEVATHLMYVLSWMGGLVTLVKLSISSRTYHLVSTVYLFFTAGTAGLEYLQRETSEPSSQDLLFSLLNTWPNRWTNGALHAVTPFCICLIAGLFRHLGAHGRNFPPLPSTNTQTHPDPDKKADIHSDL